MTVSAVNRLLLNYQPNYNYNSQNQYQGVSNRLIFAQHGKTGDDEGETKEVKQNHQRNIDHITCNDCGEKCHHVRKSDCSTQTNLKENLGAFRKTNQRKSGKKSPDVGG